MTWHRTSGLSASMAAAVSNIIANQVIPTDLTVNGELATPDSSTDVVYMENDYTGTFCGTYTWHSDADPGGKVIGLTQCMSLSGARCQRFDIYLDRSWEDGVNDALRRHLACHETGHSLGLKHAGGSNPDSCMNLPALEAYSGHEVKDHINANY